MPVYNKGANAERELIRLLFDAGFAVARVAGSGSTTLPAPDIVALKGGKSFAIEAKAWKQPYLSIDVGQMDELTEWAERGASIPIIAWKIPRKGWRFLTPRHFKSNKKYCVLSQKKALEEGLLFEQFVE
jgi:holliday junction resolvase Hjr